MRTTIDISDALMLELRARSDEGGASLKETLNQALARGLGLYVEAPWKCECFNLGPPRVDLDKALRLADALEADAVAEKWDLGK